jgi:hypothetical protein
MMILCILLLCAYFLDVIYAEQIFFRRTCFLTKLLLKYFLNIELVDNDAQ